MTLTEIKEAVKSGKDVRWKNDDYKVIPHENGPMIKCLSTGHLTGLFHSDGKTSDYNSKNFYIKNE